MIPQRAKIISPIIREMGPALAKAQKANVGDKPPEGYSPKAVKFFEKRRATEKKTGVPSTPLTHGERQEVTGK